MAVEVALWPITVYTQKAGGQYDFSENILVAGEDREHALVLAGLMYSDSVLLRSPEVVKAIVTTKGTVAD